PHEGQASKGPLAAFTAPNPLATVADYTATITWGDGSSQSAGVVTMSGNTILVSTPSAGHSYAEEGTDTLSILLTDDGTKTATASSTITVVDAPLTASPATVSSVTVNTAL